MRYDGDVVSRVLSPQGKRRGSTLCSGLMPGVLVQLHKDEFR
jgi:hypothetical protein